MERLAQRVLYQIVKGDFMPRYAVPLLLVISFAGCLEEAQLGQIEHAITDPCPKLRCGENSPQVRVHPVLDLRLRGVSDSGFRIESFTSVANEPLTLQVVWGRLKGQKLDGTLLVENDLIGARIELTTPAAETIWIQVQDVVPVPMWAREPGWQLGTAQTYLLQWTDDVNTPTPQWENLCRDTPINGEDLMGMNLHYSVLFEKDRIDPDALTVSQNSAYFSIGCAGHTLAKMYLTGHARAAAAFGLNRSVPKRTAMLKVLTADYCGIGAAMTVAGQRLEWRGADDTMAYSALPGVLEARWDDAGNLMCLSTPRIAAAPTPNGLDMFPDIEAAILDNCGVRPDVCVDADGDPETLDGAYLETRVPQP